MMEDVFGIVGSVIAGAYQVEAVVAEGGFGVVYRAHHSGFRAPVALKCLKIPQRLGAAHQAEFLEQFRAEAELLFRLSASIPTVVRPLHVDAVTMPDGTFMPFMALEWLEGETLEAISERRKVEGRSPLSLKKLLRLLTPVARALERAHNFMGPDGPISIVHRDIKPENIFVANVAGEQVVKILDFGIGKAKSVASQVAGRASQTHSSLAPFTPAYGAPEQWVPKRFGQTGPWTDVWGLALTTVEVLAARSIIDGDQAAMMGTALDPARRPTPRTEGVVVSDEVEAVFARGLALDPRDRYPEAGAFWNDLLRAAGVDEQLLIRHASGVLLRDEPRRATPGRREVATLDAATVAAGSSISRPGAAAPSSPAALPIPDAIPDLALDSAPHRSSGSMRAFTGEVDFDAGPSAGPVDLALDLEPGEVPVRRLSSSSMRAVVVPPASAPSSHGSGAGWHAAVPPGDGPLPGGTAHSSSGASWPVTEPPASAHAAAATAQPETMSSHQSGIGPGLPQVPPTRGPPALPRAERESTLLGRLLPGAVLLVASIVLTLVDQSVAASTGNMLSVGPLRAGYIAGFLMVVGVVLLVYRLLPRSSS